MTTDERVADLLEHGIGCPQAVKLGGETAVAAWCEQQELTVEANRKDAEAQEAATEDAEARVAEGREAQDAATEAAEARAAEAIEAAGGGVEVTTEPEATEPEAREPEGFVGAVLDRLDRLDGAVRDLEHAAGEAEDVPEDQKAIARQIGTILDRVDQLEGTTDRLTKAVDALAVPPKPKGKGKK